MEARNSAGKDRGEKVDLEKRLAAYYGPALPEQPLSHTSWERLRSQMDVQRPLKRRFDWSEKRSEAAVPIPIRETFARIAYQASIVYIPARLHITFKSKVKSKVGSEVYMPIVHISPMDRRNIKLVLPSTMQRTMSQVELDVLLATSVARHLYMRRPGYVLPRLLLLSIALLVGVAVVVFSFDLLRSIVLLITIIIGALLCLTLLWLLNRQGRSLAFRADTLMVGWLGRSYVCQGLHAIANSLHTSRHQRWGEPSLEERIERVCGTQVRIEDPRLTMVR